MSSGWTWEYLDLDGAPMTGDELPTAGYPTQSDAESVLGETWQQLAGAGVDAVSLYENGTQVYGPMSLRPPE